jgi:hypothetical protein
MTVKELKLELEKYPDNMDVFLAERKTEFSYGLLNSVESHLISFVESPGDEEPKGEDMVVILDEE